MAERKDDTPPAKKLTSARRLTDDERRDERYSRFSNDVAVTDEIGADYNCFGFAIKVRFFLRPPGDAQGYMSEWGYTPVANSEAPGTVVLVRDDNSPMNPWHACKHLRNGWYESKCGDGLRIVHQLGDVLRYGVLDSCWAMTPDRLGQWNAMKAKEEAEERRFAYNFTPDSFGPVEDSSTTLDQVLRVLGLAMDGP